MIPIAKPWLNVDEVKAAGQSILSGWVTQGPKVKEFEEAFSKYVGSQFAIAASNCTTALHLALLAAGVKPNDEVLTVSHSYIATANAISYCQAKPIFVDIELNNLNISLESLKSAIQDHPNAKVLLIVHQIGNPCDLKPISQLAREHDLFVIEDAACAIGSEVSMDEGKTFEKIGKPHGDLACFSFHPRKIITTGEGGMITTNNKALDEKLRLLRHQGMSVSDLSRHESKQVVVEEYPMIGYNYRMTDIQAAIGIEQLKKLPAIIEKRRYWAKRYQEELVDIDWIGTMVEENFARTNWQSFAIRIKENAPLSRDALMQFLLDHGISSRAGIMNSHQEAPYQNIQCQLPNSEKARVQTVLLPLFHSMSEAEFQSVIRNLKHVS